MARPVSKRFESNPILFNGPFHEVIQRSVFLPECRLSYFCLYFRAVCALSFNKDV